MLQWTIERLGCSKLLKKIVVATSLDSGDDEVEEFCLAQNIKCHRGPLENVAQRCSTLLRKLRVLNPPWSLYLQTLRTTPCQVRRQLVQHHQ